MSDRDTLLTLIGSAVAEIPISGKCGRDILQGAIARHLEGSGLTADTEDTRQLLRAQMPVWRSRDSGAVEPTSARRKIDIVVYSGAIVVGLIETESDLNDLRAVGTTRRNGHYDVFSVARAANGAHFDSYKSVERMASAAFYHWQQTKNGVYPSPQHGVTLLEGIRSNAASDHNPSGLTLILVSGMCRAGDASILRRRLISLGADLLCVSGAGTNAA